MAKKRKSSGEDLQTLFIQALRVLVVLGERGIIIAEDLTRKKSLTRSHPYLGEAIANVKNVISFLKAGLTVEREEPKRYAKRYERRQRKKSHQKVSKPKTL